MAKHKSRHVAKNEEEIFKNFSEQVEFLILAAKSYDEGSRNAIKMATPALRTLFYKQKYGDILIDKISIVDKTKFCSTVRYFPKTVLYTGPVIPEVLVDGDKKRVNYVYLPACYDNAIYENTITFEQWWDGILFIANKETFTRREMVRFMANQDGGAHVDSQLDRKYWDMVHNIFSSRQIPGNQPTMDLNLALMRQIVHETILSLDKMCIAHPKYDSGKGSFNDLHRAARVKLTHLTITEGTEQSEKNALFY